MHIAGKSVGVFLILALISGLCCAEYRFPDYFQFGSASSAYQTEGARNADGGGDSIWDQMIRKNPHFALDHSDASDATKSYYLYKEDIKALKDLGVNFYRFSISWPRILPNGDYSNINAAALQHYDDMIDELIKNGIEPMVTMFHWDLPQAVQNFGGWLSPLTVEYFWDFALVLFNRYGDRVKLWITINEPSVYCEHTYGPLWETPLIWAPGTEIYWCVHHMLLAHARVYHLYKDRFSYLNGKISIAESCEFHWPKNSSSLADIQAAERRSQFKCGWIFQPVFGENGGYPLSMIEAIDRRSKNEGTKLSRLPKMDDETRTLIKGTADYMALNYYTSRIAEATSEYNEPGFPHDMELILSTNSSWKRAKSEWLYQVPEGLRLNLKWIKEVYNNPTVIITENGFSDSGEIEDNERVEFFRDHMNAVLQAMHIDKCNVIGYTAWSLTDNFEWLAGYTERFGLYHIDFDRSDRPRTPKKSAKFFKHVISTRVLSEW